MAQMAFSTNKKFVNKMEDKRKFALIIDELERIIPEDSKAMKHIKEKYLSCIGHRRIVVDILAILFGMGSWIGINAVFVQLPLLVNTAPEGWSLPSFMSVAVQIANIGPLTYAILRRLFSKKLNDAYCIYFILVIGFLSQLFLSIFYKETTVIGGEERSTAFLALVFTTAIVGCTSSVLFYPFMRHFKEQYLITYFIGEGLSGFIPSIVALIQGVGGNPDCIDNPETNGTMPYYKEPLFNTHVFFGFISFSTLISFTAAVLLNTLDVCKSEMVTYKMSDMVQEPSEELDIKGNTTPDKVESNYDSISSKSENDAKFSISITRSVSLLLLMAVVCGFSNGVFPSVQSYSALPYGNVAYHLAVTLSSIANPIACFLAMFLPHTSNRGITALSITSALITAYIMATSLLSPTPPLYDQASGKALVVIVWVLAVGFVSYIKLCISTVFRMAGGSWMFYCGGATQAGSAIGSLILFFLINRTQIFQASFPCN